MSNLTDIAPLDLINELRYTPALSTQAMHLMTDGELTEAISAIDARTDKTAHHGRTMRAHFEKEVRRRRREGNEAKIQRMRARIAWEVAQDRKRS